MSVVGTLQSVGGFFARLERTHPLLPWVLAIVALLPLPLILSGFFNDYYVYLANRICIFIMLSVGLNIVKGFCGQMLLHASRVRGSFGTSYDN